MSNNATLDYFESDQMRLSVALWKLTRRAGEADFDVLRFGRDWAYADTALMGYLASEHEAVSNAAVELMQLRARLEQQQPERAHKLGAGGGASAQASQPDQPRRPAALTPASPGSAAPDDPPPQRYTRSLR